MKIKTKKQMNLPQLIEHIIKTNYKRKVYKSDTSGTVVQVGQLKSIIFKTIVFPEDIFTVEVEETVTEDTVFPSLVVVRKQHFASGNSTVHVAKINNKSIDALIDKQPINSIFEYKEIYLMDDDKLGQCIWSDGELVE